MDIRNIREIERLHRPDWLIQFDLLNDELEQKNSAWLAQKRESQRQQNVQKLFWSQ